MSNNKSLWGLTSGLAAAALLLCHASAVEAHPNVPLRDATGATLTDGVTPYSPKQTCGACHQGIDPAATGAVGSYGHGVKTAHKTQGIIESDGQIYWQSYTTAGFEHGFVVGRHSQQGRNEDYSMDMRTHFGDPFFTSSPGMYGKY